MKTYIKVIEEDNKLKKRIEELKGPYTLSLWCHQVLEREVIKLEREKMKKDNRK